MRASRDSTKLSVIALLVLAVLAVALSAAAILSNGSVPAEPATNPPLGTSDAPTDPTTDPAGTTAPGSTEPAGTEPAEDPSTPAGGAGVVVVIGDSHSLGEPSATWVGTAAAALGWSDVVNLSSPGRGYVAMPRSCDFDPCAAFQGSIPAIAEAAPDVVVTFGGVADGDYDLSEAAASYFQALREALPEAELVAIAPVTTEDTAEYWLTMHADSIGTAVEAVGGTMVNAGQPGVGDGDALSAEAQAEIAAAVVEELS